MPRLSPLPEKLRYLQPFRKQVAKLKPEEIDESMDLSLLNQLLCGRIEGLPVEEGKKILQADQAVLEEWLASPKLEDNGGMVFLHGYLMALPELVDRLLEKEDKPQKQEEIQMELPAEARIRKLGGERGWKVSWLRTTLFISPVDKKYMDYKVKDFHEGPRHHLSKVEVTPVVFGNVTGFKRLVDLSIIESMHVDYALEVPGGYASASLLVTGTAVCSLAGSARSPVARSSAA
jgi:hypothetical protein